MIGTGVLQEISGASLTSEAERTVHIGLAYRVLVSKTSLILGSLFVGHLGQIVPFGRRNHIQIERSAIAGLFVQFDGYNTIRSHTGLAESELTFLGCPHQQVALATSEACPTFFIGCLADQVEKLGIIVDTKIHTGILYGSILLVHHQDRDLTDRRIILRHVDLGVAGGL